MEGSSLDDVAACAERTLGARSARIRAWHEMAASLPERRRPRRRGGILRPLLKVGASAGRRPWQHVGEYASFSLEGFIEPSDRRHLLASSRGFAEVYKDGTRWGGKPGQPLAVLKPVRTGGGFVDVWFLLDALGGINAVTPAGEEELRGASCRRMNARVDLARASQAAPEALKPPEVDRFEDLLRLPITLWIDDAHVRRLRFDEETRNWGLELWDFGVPTDHLDWSRLPAPASA